MARRHMSFIERHIEKVALGIAGTVLLIVIALYAIRSPNRIVVEGRALTPTEFCNLLEARADQARAAIRKAPLAKLDELPQLASRASVHGEPFTVAVCPGPRVPRLEELADVRNINLAPILAPTQPIASTGKALARVPASSEVSVLSMGRRADASPLSYPQDWHWVTLAAVISRADQKRAFLTANYAPGKLDLIVTDVEAERQKQNPDGTWAQAKIIKPYRRVRLVGPHEIPLRKDKIGYQVDTRNWDWIQAYRQQLGQPEAQAAILRAPFQSCLAEQRPEDDDCFAWTVPETLAASDGTSVDLTDASYGLRFVTDEPASGVARLKGPATAFARLKQARDVLEDGWEKAGFQPYFEAVDELHLIAGDVSAPEGLRQAARRVLEPNQGEIDYATQLCRAEQAREQQQIEVGLGPPVEPMWITDTTVEPGETYRYRIRLLALNQYACLPGYLADPRDAGKVIIEGEWSPWSKAIRVKPVCHLFLIGPDDEARKTVRVQIYQWSHGAWESGSTTVGLGNSLAIEKNSTRLAYDGVVHAIDFHHPYAGDKAREPSSSQAEPSETLALILAKSDGTMEEHLAARDKTLRRTLISEIRSEEKQRRAAHELGRGLPHGTHGSVPEQAAGISARVGRQGG